MEPLFLVETGNATLDWGVSLGGLSIAVGAMWKLIHKIRADHHRDWVAGQKRQAREIREIRDQHEAEVKELREDLAGIHVELRDCTEMKANAEGRLSEIENRIQVLENRPRRRAPAKKES